MLTDPFASKHRRQADLRARGYEPSPIDELRERYLRLRAEQGLGLMRTEAGLSLSAELAGHSLRAGPSGTYVFAGPESITRLWDVEDHVLYGDVNFLVLGERGSGKEAIAHLVADAAGRAPQAPPPAAGRPRPPAAGARPVVSFNCATLVETLAVGQLFGVSAGTASGVSARSGIVKRAHGGVLFLDEFFAAPPTMFPQLLRLLEQRTYSPVGSEEEELPFSGWIVAASNRYPTEARLEAAVASGEMPGDLVDRFSARVELPPLRERRAEIPAIANNILRSLRDARGDRFPFFGVDADTSARLATLPYDWPGNIRELRRLLQTQARLRRHEGAGRDRLRIPREELEALLLGASRSSRSATSEGAREEPAPSSRGSAPNPFDRESLREQRLATVVQALRAQMARESRTRVDSRWVSAACAAIWGIERATGQKLKRSIGLDCTGLSNVLNGQQRGSKKEMG